MIEGRHRCSTPDELAYENITLQEVKHFIKNEINPKKAPGFDLIAEKVLQELPVKGIRAIT